MHSAKLALEGKESPTTQTETLNVNRKENNMDPLVTSSLISTGGSLLGGLFGGKKAPKFQVQLNDSLTAQRMTANRAWDDVMHNAKKYKIHPLAALGANVQASAPVFQAGGGDTSPSMGQNIVNSLASGASQYFMGKANEEMNKLALERAGLENELLRSQITSINNPQTAGSAYSNDQRVLSSSQKVLNLPDENIARKKDETGLTAGSENPPPAGKRFTVGNTPYGEVYITLPASGQADDYGEVYGAIKGLEYLAKRGYVHYSRGTYKAGNKLAAMLRGNKKKRPYSTPTNKGYSKITW